MVILASSSGSLTFSTQRGGAWYLSYVQDIGPYARVGRVAARENCVWASAIFKHSGSVWVKKKATLSVREVRSSAAMQRSTKDAK